MRQGRLHRLDCVNANSPIVRRPLAVVIECGPGCFLDAGNQIFALFGREWIEIIEPKHLEP